MAIDTPRRHPHLSTPFIELDTRRCRACWECVNACPTGTMGKVDIRIHKHAHVDKPDNCKGCGNCVRQCPHQAISMRELDPPQRHEPLPNHQERSLHRRANSADSLQQGQAMSLRPSLRRGSAEPGAGRPTAEAGGGRPTAEPGAGRPTEARRGGINQGLNELLMLCFPATILSGIYMWATALQQPQARIAPVDFHWHLLHGLLGCCTAVLLAVHLQRHTRWLSATLRLAVSGNLPQSVRTRLTLDTLLLATGILVVVLSLPPVRHSHLLSAVHPLASVWLSAMVCGHLLLNRRWISATFKNILR